MSIKSILSKATGRIRGFKFSKVADYQPQIDDKGLLNQETETAQPGNQTQPDQKNGAIVKTIQPTDKNQQLEKLQDGFNKLIGQLEGINENLNRQVTQHQELMSRMDKLPELLQSVPSVIENQSKITEQMLEQLNAAATKNQQFIETVEKIPTETAKQTDALTDIDHQLAAAADTDVQMTESFNKFNQTLEKLDQNTSGQTDSIMQMSKTFATSDRYLKYIISRDKKRFFWLFVISIGICVFVILTLTGIIVYLNQ